MYSIWFGNFRDIIDFFFKANASKNKKSSQLFNFFSYRVVCPNF